MCCLDVAIWFDTKHNLFMTIFIFQGKKVPVTFVAGVTFPSWPTSKQLILTWVSSKIKSPSMNRPNVWKCFKCHLYTIYHLCTLLCPFCANVFLCPETLVHPLYTLLHQFYAPSAPILRPFCTLLCSFYTPSMLYCTHSASLLHPFVLLVCHFHTSYAVLHTLPYHLHF